MSDDRFAPPRAVVHDVQGALQASPPLWNPNAAASWSLLFSPIFGAVLHLKNWQALGETAKAAAARRWVIGLIVAFVVLSLVAALIPESSAANGGFRALGLGLLFAWYFASAKEQVQLVKERYGSSYPRRGWWQPIGWALLAVVGFFVFMFAVGFAVALVAERT